MGDKRTEEFPETVKEITVRKLIGAEKVRIEEWAKRQVDTVYQEAERKLDEYFNTIKAASEVDLPLDVIGVLERGGLVRVAMVAVEYNNPIRVIDPSGNYIISDEMRPGKYRVVLVAERTGE